MKAGYFALTAALLMTLWAPVQAGVVVGGTRLIYDGGKKESALNINNPDAVPYLIQSWVDAQEGDSAKAPFIITPPLFRLDGAKITCCAWYVRAAIYRRTESRCIG